MAPVDVTGGRSAPRAGRLRDPAPRGLAELGRWFLGRGLSPRPGDRRVVLGLEAAMGCRETLKWLAEAEGDTLHERP